MAGKRLVQATIQALREGGLLPEDMQPAADEPLELYTKSFAAAFVPTADPEFTEQPVQPLELLRRAPPPVVATTDPTPSGVAPLADFQPLLDRVTLPLAIDVSGTFDLPEKAVVQPLPKPLPYPTWTAEDIEQMFRQPPVQPLPKWNETPPYTAVSTPDDPLGHAAFARERNDHQYASRAAADAILDLQAKTLNSQNAYNVASYEMHSRAAKDAFNQEQRIGQLVAHFEKDRTTLTDTVL